MSELIDKLNWRYAAKRMTGEVVPQDKLNNILEAIKLAPSSAGLQPYNVLVIDNKDIKEQIHKIANNQPQILEASHLLVFGAWEKVTAENLTKYINLIATTRAFP
jgi:nitroreductase/dihydropteridine reductase